MKQALICIHKSYLATSIYSSITTPYSPPQIHDTVSDFTAFHHPHYAATAREPLRYMQYV